MMRALFVRVGPLFPLAAVGAALALSGCVAPGAYAPYPSQAAYAQPAYAQPTYPSQPAYAEPAYTSQPAYAQPDYPPSVQGEAPYGNQPPPPAQGYGYAMQYGVISDIQPLNKAASPSGVAGTLVGAVVGGVLGNQIGRGHGRDVATVVGALGGAVAGNQIGQQYAQPSGYRVVVRLSDGSSRAFDVPSPGDLRPGERVRVDGNQLSRY
jgi:outer membrane lipoprotein SlyB